ncbi:Bug family tripartite tricarboxylate transporter substrate binding protein [Pseudorhodoferax sp.]|uniref:Bug family tripartite tricarboxylate transporter substrate binding protein n=1 Tax=Pseudorhodoferax sp. TaxID=1993553 RepID=UPI002DD623FC|nr:tripartite tricarboxylate transporter substrate binding protein [Pseudorhodoferax sp.]
MSTPVSRRRHLQLLAAGAAAAAGLPVPARAAAYPSKPVNIVVPFPPGGATDVVGRLLAEHLTGATGQSFVVSNVAGASGSIGHQQVARAEADGHTLVIGTASTMPGNAAYNKLSWDPVADFTPIGLISTESMSVIVHPSVPVNSVQELIALAKSKPGQLNMASFGNGSIAHLAGELFKSMAGVDMLHVPFQGSGPALTAMVGGHVQVMFHTLSVSLPHVQAGRLKMLAITDSKRKTQLPDMPTVAEAGVPGYSAITWLGLFGPKGLPPDIVAKLSDESQRMLAKPDVRERLLKMASEPASGKAAELASVLGRDLEKWRKTIEVAGIKRE